MNINFSIESFKKPIIYDLLFFITVYSPKISINVHWNEKLAQELALDILECKD